MDLLNVTDVANRLRLSTRQVWKLADSGHMPKPVRIGRSVRWRASDIDAWVEADCTTPERTLDASSPAHEDRKSDVDAGNA